MSLLPRRKHATPYATFSSHLQRRLMRMGEDPLTREERNSLWKYKKTLLPAVKEFYTQKKKKSIRRRHDQRTVAALEEQKLRETGPANIIAEFLDTTVNQPYGIAEGKGSKIHRSRSHRTRRNRTRRNRTRNRTRRHGKKTRQTKRYTGQGGGRRRGIMGCALLKTSFSALEEKKKQDAKALQETGKGMALARRTERESLNKAWKERGCSGSSRGGYRRLKSRRYKARRSHKLRKRRRHRTRHKR